MGGAAVAPGGTKSRPAEGAAGTPLAGRAETPSGDGAPGAPLERSGPLSGPGAAGAPAGDAAASWSAVASRPSADEPTAGPDDGFAYFFREDGLFVLPIEQLSPEGVRPAFARALLARGALTADGLVLFDRALQACWERVGRLHRAAPAYWPPPRLQHVGVVTRPDHVRPYFEPFHRSAWLVYAADLDPATSSAELAAFLLVQAERMALMRQILPALGANLSYLLTLSEEEAEDLAAGCRRSTRPDAAGYAALADALPVLRRLHHVHLRAPRVAVPGAAPDPATGLVVAPSAWPTIGRLDAAWAAAAQTAVERHVRAHAAPPDQPGGGLAAWLVEARPAVVVTGPDEAIAWDPARPKDTSGLDALVAPVTASAARSIRADLEAIDHHTRRFLSALVDPEALADPAPYMTAGGLSYIHPTRKRVAYQLGGAEHAGRLHQASPPYERLMLEARTVHEWGHLAAESGWVGIPEASRATSRALYRLIAEVFDAAVAEAPRAVSAATAAETERLRARHGSVGRALARGLRTRLEDYMANLLARRFLSPDALQTYVRNNVASRATAYDPAALYQQLLLHAYEVQYLTLAGIADPMRYVLCSTWFEARFLQSGAIREVRWEELVAAVGALCALVAVDEARFRPVGEGG